MVVCILDTQLYKMAICDGSICLRIEMAKVSKNALYPLLDDAIPNNLKTKYIYYPKVLTGHFHFIDFLQTHKQSYSSIYIPKQADVSVNLDIKRFDIHVILNITSRIRR